MKQPTEVDDTPIVLNEYMSLHNDPTDKVNACIYSVDAIPVQYLHAYCSSFSRRLLNNVELVLHNQTDCVCYDISVYSAFKSCLHF